MARQSFFSPAELSYLHSSLTLDPPVRPDGRSSTQFRPLEADTDIIANANGSARVCFSDGSEAITGIKLELQRSSGSQNWEESREGEKHEDGSRLKSAEDKGETDSRELKDSWLEVAIDIPGFRDDDNLPVLLSSILTESLLASDYLKSRLFINDRFHWKLYVDILLLSSPASYPLPLLSLASHLALISTKVPLLISEKEDDPLFSDDWALAPYLYPILEVGNGKTTPKITSRPTDTRLRESYPPITLLIAIVGTNTIFDPSKEELMVAESVLAVSVDGNPLVQKSITNVGSVLGSVSTPLRLLSVRTIESPSRFTASGVPDSLLANSEDGFGFAATSAEAILAREGVDRGVVWCPPRGGVKRGLLGRVIHSCTRDGGVGADVLTSLRSFA